MEFKVNLKEEKEFREQIKEYIITEIKRTSKAKFEHIFSEVIEKMINDTLAGNNNFEKRVNSYIEQKINRQLKDYNKDFIKETTEKMIREKVEKHFVLNYKEQ